MRGLVQRVQQASVTVMVDGMPEVTGTIGPGLCVLVGVTHDDSVEDAAKLANKIVGLRIMDDEDGVMNRSVLDTGGDVLIVSQFTLYGDAAKGRRPSWIAAARPEVAEPLVERVISDVQAAGVTVQTGRFRTDMVVNIVNDGPVTLMLEI